MDTLLPIVFALLLVSCGAGLVLHHIFLSKLRTRHSKTWEALGRPALFLNNSITNGLAVLRFLWGRDYHALGDVEFSRFATFLRGYMVAYFILFILTVIIFVVAQVSK